MLLAEQSDAPRVCVALDARMNEIYFAAYERDAAQSCGWRAVVAPTLAKPDDLPALAGGGWTGIGSAFGHEPLRGVLLKRLGACLAATLDDAHPRAREALVIGARALVGGGMSLLVPAREASPLYVRNDVALTLKERAAARAEADA
jgi:tRNA threonylcarbamoyladenosine biosynthesis protein TsaB